MNIFCKLLQVVNYAIAIVAVIFSVYLLLLNIFLGNHLIAFGFAIIAAANSANIYTINVITYCNSKLDNLLSYFK